MISKSKKEQVSDSFGVLLQIVFCGECFSFFYLFSFSEIHLITHIPHVSSDIYLDPKSFNPDRFLKGSNESKENQFFMPFGAGHKVCLGQRLALLEIKYLFVRFLQKYEIFKAKNPNLKTQCFRGFTSLKKITVGIKERV